MIKTVIFDFGGVIYLSDDGNILGRVADAVGVSPETFRNTYYENNYLGNVQNMPWEDLVATVAKKFDARPETEVRVRQLVKEFNERKYLNTELMDLFAILRRSGLKVAILSNATTELRGYLEENGIDALVDEVVISGEIGFQKPDKEAFDVVFKKLGVRPEEAVFVDDSPRSLEKAKEIGYTPILFKSNEALRADLERCGVTIPRGT